MCDLQSAKACERCGEFVDALRIYRRLYAQEPNREEVVQGVAQCAMALDRLEIAFEFYVRLLILNNANPRGYLGRAQVMFAYNQHDKALSDVERAIALDEPATELRIDCAALLNDYGYVEMARDALLPLRETMDQNDDFVCEWVFAQIALGNGHAPETEALLNDIAVRWEGDPFVSLCRLGIALRDGDESAAEELRALLEEAPDLVGKIETLTTV